MREFDISGQISVSVRTQAEKQSQQERYVKRHCKQLAYVIVGVRQV